MVRLTDKDITEFQRIYKEQFGKEISRQEALEQGSKLVRLMEIVYRPLPNSTKAADTKKDERSNP